MLTLEDIRELAVMINDAKWNYDVEPEDNLFTFRRMLMELISIRKNNVTITDDEIMLELINRALFIYNLEPDMLKENEEKNPDYPSEEDNYRYYSKHKCENCKHLGDHYGEYCYECTKGIEDNFEEKAESEDKDNV